MTDSPHTADIVERLMRRLEDKDQRSGTGWIDATGKGGWKMTSGPMLLVNPDGPEAAAIITELREALEPFTRGPDGTSLAKLYAHLNREHYHRAKAALATQEAPHAPQE